MKPDPDNVLSDLQSMDGVLWLRILGQQHWQFNELPFWVLLEGEDQLSDAVAFLQDKLRPLNDASEAIVTVGFHVYRGNQDISLNYYEGEDFFSLAPEEVVSSPIGGPRRKSVFDSAYPNDPWSLEVSHERR